MPSSAAAPPQADRLFAGWRLLALGALAAAMLVPVTMPVTVLRGLVHDRYGVSEFATSWFMSINMIAAILAAPLMGVLADRSRFRPRLIAAASLADALAFVAMAYAPTFAWLMTIRFFEGIAHMLALSTLLALIADVSARRGPIMGMAGAGITLGVAVGAPLGGVLGRTTPELPLLAGGGVLVLVAAAALALLREVPRREAQPTLREALGLVGRTPAVLVPWAFAFADRFSTGFFTATFSLFMRRVFELDPAEIGRLIAVFMLPFSLLSFPVGRLSERVSRSGLLLGGSLVYGVATASLGWWSADALIWLMLLLGVSAAVMFVPSLLVTADLVESRFKATALYGFNAAGAFGFVLGPLVGGWVSQTVAATASWEAGYTAAFVVAGAVELLCVAATWPFLLRLRRAGRIT